MTQKEFRQLLHDKIIFGPYAQYTYGFYIEPEDFKDPLSKINPVLYKLDRRTHTLQKMPNTNQDDRFKQYQFEYNNESLSEVVTFNSAVINNISRFSSTFISDFNTSSTVSKIDKNIEIAETVIDQSPGIANKDNYYTKKTTMNIADTCDIKESRCFMIIFALTTIPIIKGFYCHLEQEELKEQFFKADNISNCSFNTYNTKITMEYKEEKVNRTNINNIRISEKFTTDWNNLPYKFEEIEFNIDGSVKNYSNSGTNTSIINGVMDKFPSYYKKHYPVFNYSNALDAKDGEYKLDEGERTLKIIGHKDAKAKAIQYKDKSNIEWNMIVTMKDDVVHVQYSGDYIIDFTYPKDKPQEINIISATSNYHNTDRIYMRDTLGVPYLVAFAKV